MRHRVALQLAWLPCMLCAAAWPASYGRSAYVTLPPVVLCVEHGATYAYLRGSRVSSVLVDAGISRPRVPTIEEGWGGRPVQRWRPWRYVDGVHVVPLWVPTLALAAPPLWLTRRRRRQRSPDQCVKCGYDLRATPERCPECGTIRAA